MPRWRLRDLINLQDIWFKGQKIKWLRKLFSMTRKQQIVSINFMSNFVFVGRKLHPGQVWCTVGGRTYWNSARIVSQPLQRSTFEAGFFSPYKSASPPSFSLLILGPTAHWGSSSAFVCISYQPPGPAHLCLEPCLECLCFSPFSHLTPVSL